MAKAPMPTDLQKAHLTKEEIEKRKEQEQKLKGNDDLVYEPPTHLSKKEKELYKFIINELEATKILNNLDITILETTVDAIIKMQECNKLIKKHGLLTVRKDGSLVRNPASVIYKDYNAIFNKCCMELGLSPSARARLSIFNLGKKEKNEDPVLKVIRGGGK